MPSKPMFTEVRQFNRQDGHLMRSDHWKDTAGEKTTESGGVCQNFYFVRYSMNSIQFTGALMHSMQARVVSHLER
jgi:hypothetical protein